MSVKCRVFARLFTCMSERKVFIFEAILNYTMAIKQLSAFKTGNFLRPSDEIDPNKKANDPQYSLDWSKFIYGFYMKDGSAIKSDMANRFVRNRSYAEGRQDTTQYKNWIFGRDKDKPNIPVIEEGTDRLVNDIANQDLGLENINFDDVFSPLPKYVENIIGMMRSQNHDIVVEAVDENSGAAKEELKFASYIKAQLQAFLARFNAAFEIPNMNEEPIKPKSLQELELFDNIGAFKLPYEIATEKLVLHTMQLSDFDEVTKDDIIRDLIVDGYSSVVTVQDPTNGKFFGKRKDVLDVILEDSRDRDFKDSSWGGYIEYYTIHKLRVETGWKEDKLASIAERWKGEFGNPEEFDAENDHGRYRYDDYRVPVLHSFWKTVDTEYTSERQTKNGPVEFPEPYIKNGTIPPKERKNRKQAKVSIRRLYNAKWVLDSEEVFGHGVVSNTPYNFGLNDVEFPIKMYRVNGKPKMESMIPIEDQIYLTFIKTQSAIAKAAPPGIAVEWGAIQNISYGSTKLEPKDSIRIYNATGNIVYELNATSIPGQQNRHTGTPVTELKGGMGGAISDGITGIEFLYRQLDVITGIDGISSVTQQPNRDTGKAVTEMAVAATSNTLKPIYNGYIMLKVSCARTAVWGAQAMLGGYSINDIESCPYFRVLGRGNLSAIMSAGNFPPTVYGFHVEARSTEFEKQRILEAAAAGMQGGKNGIPALTFSEYSFVVRFLNSGKSIKYLELWMAKKEQDRAAKEQQMAQENIAAQEEQLQKTVQLKAQLEEAKIDKEGGWKLKEIEAKGEQERLTLAEKAVHDEKLLSKQMKLKAYSTN